MMAKDMPSSAYYILPYWLFQKMSSVALCTPSSHNISDFMSSAEEHKMTSPPLNNPRRWHWRVLFGTFFLLLCGAFPSIGVSTVHYPVSDKSVYVPGSGFSGFWFHLALFRSMPDVHEYDYYCFSSACLSVVLGILQTPVLPVFGHCREIQLEWLQGRLSRYQIVDEFLHRLIPTEEDVLSPLLSRINIISTSLEHGVEILQPTNRSELVTALKRTTWIPFLTGQGWLKDDINSGRYIDGYFSVPFHPPCRYTAKVPFSWEMYLHSLNPAVGTTEVMKFVEQGTNLTKPFQMDLRWNTGFQSISNS